MLSTRTTIGSIGVLANHAPLMAMLEPTELRLYQLGLRDRALRPGRGLPPGGGQPALVLVEEAIAPEDLDRGAFESRLQEAREAPSARRRTPRSARRAEREIRRYEAFLKVDSKD